LLLQYLMNLSKVPAPLKANNQPKGPAQSAQKLKPKVRAVGKV
jgi:hypothetical protein